MREAIQRFDELGRAALDATDPLNALAMGMDVPADDLEQLANLKEELGGAGLDDWCEFDLGIVRGLAYYTGTVFEIHERSGKERAIAGGGRYDDLVELFGGAPTPAVGIAMGDVVIRLVLEDRGLLEPAEAYMPRPDVFVIASGDGPAQAELRPLVARLRGLGLHVRRSYRTTTNVGKLLGEAGRVRARYAVILGRELEEGSVVLKDLDAGDQREVTLTDLPGVLSGAPDR